MTNEDQIEGQRRHSLELLRAARESLRPTAKSRLFGVTSRMLDRAYEEERAIVEEVYDARIANLSNANPTSAASVTSASPAKSRRPLVSGAVLSKDEVAAVAADYRQRGMKIVFTNGCFDLLHRGHIGYLIEARKLGDVLFLGLNSDASVRRLKGEKRPVLQAEDRAEILVALRSVDYVVIFDEDTAEDLVDLIQPDVYVKGGDYNPEFPTPEARRAVAHGGEYHVVSYIESASTTQLIERITKARK